MRFFVRVLQFFYVIYALLLFVSLMLLVFPFAVAASFFGKIRGGNFIYRLCRVWADIWLLFIGIFHKNIYVGTHKTDHACIFVANHISYMDVVVLIKTLPQPIRILGNIEMSKIPIFGFLYRKAVVMVDRSNVENRARSVKTLTSILRKGISIVIFPEGTFNTTGQPLKDFYSGAFRIALETQTPIKPVIFPDTIDRLHHEHMFSLTPGISRAVFMEEVPVEGMVVHDAESLKSKVWHIMDAELRKWRNYDAPKTVSRKEAKEERSKE